MSAHMAFVAPSMAGDWTSHTCHQSTVDDVKGSSTLPEFLPDPTLFEYLQDRRSGQQTACQEKSFRLHWTALLQLLYTDIS